MGFPSALRRASPKVPPQALQITMTANETRNAGMKR
jgi:hypothetical protein